MVDNGDAFRTLSNIYKGAFLAKIVRVIPIKADWQDYEWWSERVQSSQQRQPNDATENESFVRQLTSFWSHYCDLYTQLTYLPTAFLVKVDWRR